MSQKGIPKNKPKICETHPQFVDWMYDKDDAKRYSYGAKTKIDWICPNCGSKVEKISVAKVILRNRVPCKICSDNISYPNKLMYNILEQLKVDFIAEYSPDWIKPKRYDFYLPNFNLIVEMDGGLGHGRKTMGNMTPSESKDIDIYKDKIAKKHFIDVIRIDCCKSDLDYIKHNIINSRLSALFDFYNVDFLLCNNNATTSYKIKVCECWEKYHDIQEILKQYSFARPTINRWLRECSKYGLCDYNPKQQMVLSGKRNIANAYNANKKSVICLELQNVFESCREAYQWLGYNDGGHSIQDNCKGITKSAGKDPITKQKLHWMFYDEYLKLEGCS